MKSSIAIIGAGRTKFGEFYETEPEVLIEEAWIKASGDGPKPDKSKISSKDLSAIFSSSFLIDTINKVKLPEGILSELTDLRVPIENSKSFSSAFHAACNAIDSGRYEIALVGGVEKMTDRWDKIGDDLMMFEDPRSYYAGLTKDSNHEFMLRYYIKKDGISGEALEKFNRALAMIPVKNHANAMKNPNAQYQRKITIEQVISARKEARKPLGLYDYAPISDGAAVLIITTKENAKSYTNPVYVKGRSSATNSLTYTSRDERIGFPPIRIAMENALKEAGISREDITVAEICDQSSFTEMISLEDLGFSRKGEGWRDAYESLVKGSSYQMNGTSLSVNANGGLKADGNPLGAAGGAQFYEIFRQLRGESGNQVSEARYGLVSEIEGFGTKGFVTILGRD